MSQSPKATRPLAVRIARRIPYARAAADRIHAWRLSHQRSAKNTAQKNTLRAYNRLYRSDSLLAEYLGPERLAFYDEVAAACSLLQPRSVIDVGCGTGHLLGSLVDQVRVEPDVVVGVDHSRAAIARARAVLPTARWIVRDLYELTLAERFELVLCTEVLEHVREPAQAVDVLCGLCASDGRVAVTVPDGAQDSWEGHVNFWNENEFRAFLAPYGLVGLDRIQDGAVLLGWLTPNAG